MSDKPDLKLIEAAASDDPYDLGRLRIDPEKLETASTKRLLTTVPVKKPNAQDFIRVRPELDYRETLALVELQDDRETYIVDLGAVRVLLRERVRRYQPGRGGVLVAGQSAGNRSQGERMAHLSSYGSPARHAFLGARQVQHEPRGLRDV